MLLIGFGVWSVWHTTAQANAYENIDIDIDIDRFYWSPWDQDEQDDRVSCPCGTTGIVLPLGGAKIVGDCQAAAVTYRS